MGGNSRLSGKRENNLEACGPAPIPPLPGPVTFSKSPSLSEPQVGARWIVIVECLLQSSCYRDNSESRL